MAKIDPNEKTDLLAWLKMVAALQHAPDWLEDEKPIAMKQTHISVLLLSRNYVVKLKKPVDFGFLDYSTLAKREQAVEDEVNLNRRLCHDVYIGYGGVIDTNGQINFSGRHGTIVDYCVWMRRLPDDRMLDQLVARSEVTEAMIDAIAARLSEFHRTARRGAEVAKWGSLAEIRHNWEENFAQTEAFIGRTISASDYEAIRTWVNQWLTTKAELFRRRVPRIVDGHGDVRCESVCVTDKDIYIYDCIEFNDRFRCDEVASEVAFLAMDLAARDRPDLGYFFTEAYERRIGDNDFFTLLPFYRCYRAFVRGKVLSFALNEPEFSPAEKDAAAQQAEHYFALARRYAIPLPQPTVIAVTGLPGTGKTSVARALACEFGMRVVSADAMRKELFGAAKKPAGYEQGAYTPEANRLTYEKLLAIGREYLQRDGGVVLDATFRHAENRAQAQTRAAAAGAEWCRIECQLAPELVRERLEKRAANHEGLSDATWEIYLQHQAEQPAAAPDAARLILDTAGSFCKVAQTATDWLRSTSQSTNKEKSMLTQTTMNPREAIRYGYKRTLDVALPQALKHTREALKEEGFGVLFEIDIKEKLQEKLGVEFNNYVILGACNPSLAYQTLQQEIDIGLLLPCNVIGYEQNGQSIVAAIDAQRMMTVVGNPQLEAAAGEVSERLHRVIDSL